MTQDQFPDQSPDQVQQPEAEAIQEYSLYELIIGKQRVLLTLSEAGKKLHEHGFDNVASGTFVYEGPGSSRPMEDEDRWKIAEAATILKLQTREFPRYQMIVGGKIVWCPLNEAALFHNNALLEVSFGTIVHDSLDDDPREMTDDDQRRITQAADRISRST